MGEEGSGLLALGEMGGVVACKARGIAAVGSSRRVAADPRGGSTSVHSTSPDDSSANWKVATEPSETVAVCGANETPS